MTEPRYLTKTFAVSPQITPQDLEGLRDLGFETIVCNRPDSEVPQELGAEAMEAACQKLGLNFVLNPLSHGSLSKEHIDIQRDAATSTGPVLAYCASGNRSSILWGLAMAGEYPTEDILSRTSKAGYNLEGMVPYLEALAGKATG